MRFVYNVPTEKFHDSKQIEFFFSSVQASAATIYAYIAGFDLICLHVFTCDFLAFCRDFSSVT